MSNTRTLYWMAAVLLGLAAIEPSSADSQRKRSDAFEQILPSFASAQDYWSASKISFQLASNHHRLNEPQAACEALAQSLGYYRMALTQDTNPPAWEVAVVNGDDGDGMQEIRSRFGCTRTQFG